LGAAGFGAARPLTGAHTILPPLPVEVAHDSPGVEHEASALVLRDPQGNVPSFDLI